MKKISPGVLWLVAILSVLVCAPGCSRRSPVEKSGESASVDVGGNEVPPQDQTWVENLRTDLLFTRYLDENSDVAIIGFSPNSKIVRPLGMIQGELWFSEGEGDKVPFDFALEVTDRPGKMILFRQRTNPGTTPSGFIDKATEAEIKRLEILGKEPYTPPGERLQAFLGQWDDIVLVRCDQIAGNIRDFHAYKGDHFKTDEDIKRYKDLIIQEGHKTTYMEHSECVLYGNFERDPKAAHVVWIAQSYLLFPGRRSIFGGDFKQAASKLRGK